MSMCTLEKSGALFMLTITGVDEHRVNPTLISSLRTSLRQAKDQATRGSVLVTKHEGKFLSNGFDTAWAQSTAARNGGSVYDLLVDLSEQFRPVMADFVSLPMPTIAAVTGHAAAAGLMLPLSHDYVMMRGDRGVMYFSELDWGMAFPDYFPALVREKVGSPAARRDLLLRAVKMKAAEAKATGIVDSVHENPEATVAAAVRLGEELAKRNWIGEVYADIRLAMYPELCSVLGLAPKGVRGFKDVTNVNARI